MNLGVMKLFALISLCFVMAGCGIREMTQSQASDMITKAGGVQNVNQEATRIFDRFGTNESTILFGSELTNYPTLSALGKPLFIQAETNGFSSHIAIPFGSHYQRNFVIIFNPGSPVKFSYLSEFNQVATNIFVGK
jgi:hypothetical protein